MKLFQTSHGFIISFGFNMLARRRERGFICWCDPATHEWEGKGSNLAGSMMLPLHVTAGADPEFVREIVGNGVLAYSPGLCLEMRLIGPPLVWSFHHLFPEGYPERIAA